MGGRQFRVALSAPCGISALGHAPERSHPSHPKKEQEMLFGKRQPEPVYVEWTLEYIEPADLEVTDDEIRRIVREELAEFIPVDVPDAPPEDLR